MRVIAGTARSLKLIAPEGEDTRPTLDRYKETLFNVIQTEIPFCRFLDLFAGSGAVGIEALSRGASFAAFVDSSKESIRCINDNLNHTHLADKAQVVGRDVFSTLPILKGGFDVVFIDPPYGKLLERRVLELLPICDILKEDTLIIVESDLETDLDYVYDLGYEITKVKEYKTNKHTFMKRRDD